MCWTRRAQPEASRMKTRTKALMQQPAIQPMEQFMVHRIVTLPTVHLGGLAIDLSITNSVLSMIVGAVLLVLFFALTAKREIVPNRGQALAESL